VSLDAVDGPMYILELARIQSLVGEHEAALDSLEQFVSFPAGTYVSASNLGTDPAFRPLHASARFRRLAGLSG